MNRFRHIARYDVRPLQNALALHAPRWRDITFRQDHPLSPHPNSETIFLRWAPGQVTVDSVLHSLDVVDLPLGILEPFSTAIRSIASFADGEPARAIIVKMRPGGAIKRHIDEGRYAEATDRYHLPIQTNPGAWLSVDGEKTHIPEGEIWWFNKHAPHEGGNDGSRERIHLIVDCFRAAPCPILISGTNIGHQYRAPISGGFSGAPALTVCRELTEFDGLPEDVGKCRELTEFDGNCPPDRGRVP